MAKLVTLASLFFLLQPLQMSFAETPRQNIFRAIFHQFMKEAERKTHASWVTLGDEAFSKALTLRASEMIRAGFREDISNKIYARILQTVRGRLSCLMRRPTSQKEVIEQIENESGKNLEALYEEMVDIFKSPDDLIRFIETNRWAKEAISAYDYNLLKTVASRYQFSTVSNRQTFRNFLALRQDQLFAEMNACAKKAAEGALPDEATIEAIFRNLSVQHNFLWSYAKANLGIAISFHLSQLNRHPSLRTRWFSLRRRAKELMIPRRLLPYEVKFTHRRWLLGAARIPYGYRLVNDPQAISEFFRELSSLLAEAASPAPGHLRTFFSLPGGFIRNSVEHRARILSSDFDLLTGLEHSAEFENAVIAKKLEASYMQRYFEVYKKEGLPGLVKAVTEAEGGYHPLGWEFKLPDSKWRALLTFWFPWTYKQGDRLRGQYFRKWLSYHGMTLFLVMLISQGADGEEEIETPPYVDDSFLKEPGKNGDAPQDAKRALLELISQKLQEKKRLVLEFEDLKTKLERRESAGVEAFLEIQNKASHLGKKIERLDEELEELKEGLKAVIQISEPGIQPLIIEIERLTEEIQGLTEQYDLTMDENEKRRLHRQVKEIDKYIESYQEEMENILTKKADEVFQRLWQRLW
jgi:hypothetical protein